MRFFGSLKIQFVKTGAVLWIHLTHQMCEVILVSSVLQHNLFRVKWDVPTIHRLVKQILRYQDHPNVSVMAAFRK